MAELAWISAFTKEEVIDAFHGACVQNGWIPDWSDARFMPSFESGWARGIGKKRGPKDEPQSEPPPTSPDLTAAVERLAKLSPLEYDRCRKEEAQKLGVRGGTLDEAVKAGRSKDHGDDRRGEAFKLADPEPWPDPVDGAALLDELTAMFSRHVSLPPGAAEALALWVLHCHAHDAAAISPIMAITSPAPECGKTTLLSLLEAVAPRALAASNITTAALFRTVELLRPTLLVDEADTFLRENDELRGILNSGHNRATAFVVRTVGDDHEPRRFRTWAPKAIALIGQLHPTLESRSIEIPLQRMGAGERLEPVRLDRLDKYEPLRRKAWRWSRDHLAELGEADPAMPRSLFGRLADNWRPLLAIADMVGRPDWSATARYVAEALSTGRASLTAGVMVLEDLAALFEERGGDQLTSSDIITALSAMEMRPWPEWKNDKPITQAQLARLLRPFGIYPGTIRIGSETPKGYRREQFDDTFARYLPPAKSPTSEPPHRHNPHETAKNCDSEPQQPATDVAAQKRQKPKESAPCGGVAAEKGETKEEEGETGEWIL